MAAVSFVVLPRIAFNAMAGGGTMMRFSFVKFMGLSGVVEGNET